MKKNLILSLSILGLLFFNACDKDDDQDMEYGYEVRIMSPNADDKKVGDEVHLHVNFTSSTGETIHNVNVKIYKEDDHSVVLYDGPTDEHVHATEGNYEIHADLALTEANGVAGHTNWIVEAKVWPHGDDEHNHDEDDEHNHEDEEHTVTEMLKFHVHPN